MGIDDPEQWLHEAEERKLAIWEAFFKVEPWGCDWERSAMVAQVVSNTVASCHGVKSRNLYKLADFMPTTWHGRKRNRKSGNQSIENFRKFAQRYQK